MTQGATHAQTMPNRGATTGRA